MDQIDVIDLVPKFLSFYEKATAASIDEDQRFLLWEEHYNFAALPPTENRRSQARVLLNEAWDKYGERIEYIRGWKSEINSIKLYLSQVKALLDCHTPIEFVVVYFVGAFEENAFVTQIDSGKLALCLPVENGKSDVMLAHELTHIVHSQTAQFSAQWERTIASTIVQEGLATQVSKRLIPGLPDEEYIEFTYKGWLKSCERHKEAIYKGVYPYLDDSSSDAVYKFTMGDGASNHKREAYFVGWKLIQALLDLGVSFSEIAKVKEAELPEFVRSHYHRLL